jgi:hypothetical protein
MSSVISSCQKGVLYKQSKHSLAWQKRYCSINGSFLTIHKSSTQDSKDLVAMVDLAQVGNVYISDKIQNENGHFIVLQILSKTSSNDINAAGNDENQVNASNSNSAQLFKLKAMKYEEAAYWVALISYVSDQSKTGMIKRKDSKSFKSRKNFSGKDVVAPFYFIVIYLSYHSGSMLSRIAEEEVDTYKSYYTSFSTTYGEEDSVDFDHIYRKNSALSEVSLDTQILTQTQTQFIAESSDATFPMDALLLEESCAKLDLSTIDTITEGKSCHTVRKKLVSRHQTTTDCTHCSLACL